MLNGKRVDVKKALSRDSSGRVIAPKSSRGESWGGSGGGGRNWGKFVFFSKRVCFLVFTDGCSLVAIHCFSIVGGQGNMNDFPRGGGGGGGNWVDDDYAAQDFGGGGYGGFGGAGGGGGPMRKGPNFGNRSGPYNAGKHLEFDW